jgi:hypothetical protein
MSDPVVVKLQELVADEGRAIGGSEPAPTPLSYFATAIAS